VLAERRGAAIRVYEWVDLTMIDLLLDAIAC